MKVSINVFRYFEIKYPDNIRHEFPFCLPRFQKNQYYTTQFSVQFSSVAQSCPTLCDPWTAAC